MMHYFHVSFKDKYTYKLDASSFTEVIFASSLVNILVIYCNNCQILLFLLHSEKPHDVHNSPLSGFLMDEIFEFHNFLKHIWMKNKLYVKLIIRESVFLQDNLQVES